LAAHAFPAGWSPRSILIVRTSALGDVVHALPVASALRAAYPAARIGWVVEEPFLPLAASHPAVDEAIPVALRRWRRAPFAADTRRALAELRRRLRAFAPEVALDLMGNHKAGALALLAGAEHRVGARRGDRREPSSALWMNRHLEVHGSHAVDRALSLAAQLGASTARPDFAGDALLRGGANAGEEDAGYVLLQPGAMWANKRWPATWWGELAATLAAAGRRLRVLTGPGEEPLAAAVVTASRGSATAVSPGPLPELAHMLRGAALVIGGDTGPLHLAHALGVPVLALHGPTDPARHGPYGAVDRALWKQLPCSFCYRRFDDSRACLLELSPARVAARATELLGGN
jgi:heptosyltransferase I